jgi:acetolactate synthase-1/2/3 large subunit
MTHQPIPWITAPADEAGDAIIAALAHGGVDHLFFTSGSEIMFFQEAIAKARAHGRKAPRLITMTHEYAGLNAALGYAAVTGRPVATAAHVDVGTQHYGCAIHTAWWAGLPILIMAGAPPVSYPGAMRGGRDGAHFWIQQTLDQNAIMRPYTKWDHRLEHQDNPGLIVSRALQVAQSEPQGPVYLSLPREIAVAASDGAMFPTVDQLGIPRPPGPDSAGLDELARRLAAARNPYILISRSGRNPATVPALVALCELLSIPVVDAGNRTYQCFPFDHPLYQGTISVADADVAIVIDADVPWLGEAAPGPDAFAAAIGLDPAMVKIPTFEFCANLRLIADPLKAIVALHAAVQRIGVSPEIVTERRRRWENASRTRRQKLETETLALAKKSPIDPAWLAFQICEASDENCLMIDDTLSHNPLSRFLKASRPGSYFRNPGSGGGWGPGAALGAKLAAPERDVIAVTGDGFYMYSAANSALWAARQYNAPFMTVVFQNRSYSTGTRATANFYPKGYAVQSGLEGGYFDPPVDFAKEAEAAGAYGENVRSPDEVGPALKRGLAKTREGIPAVISVWLPRLLQQT